MKKVNQENKKRCLQGASALAGVLLFASMPTLALSPSYYAAQSKLSTDKWVKIKTPGEGVCEITYDQLREWGFANPEKVNVYGYGATLLSSDVFDASHPDDVALTYTLHEGDKLYFYSTSDVTVKPVFANDVDVERARNYYSTKAYYLLSDRQVDGTEPSTVAYAPGRQAEKTHYSLVYSEEELQNPTGVGAYFLGANIPAEGLDVTFGVKDADGGDTGMASYMGIGFAALGATPTLLNVELAPESGYVVADEKGTAALASDYAYDRYKTGNLTRVLSGVPEGDDVTVHLPHPGNGQSFVAIDYAWLLYPRTNAMDDGQISMFFPQAAGSSNFSIECSPTTHVINVTTPAGIFEHATEYDTDAKTLSGSFDKNYTATNVCHLVAFDTQKQQQVVEFAGDVENQNLHGVSTPDMVIITVPALLNEAEELAEMHRRTDGMDVLVVDHNKIFNEYSSATPDAMGYRRFLKMLRDRESSKLKYVIMYGSSIWDNRGIIVPHGDRLIVYESVDPIYSGVTTRAFATDCYFGMLSDNYNPSDILRTQQDVAVGRIPVMDGGEAKAINNKIRRHLENPLSGTVYDTFLIMSDDGDNNSHLNQAEDLVSTVTRNLDAMTVVRAHNSIYTWESNYARILHDVAISAFNRGTGVWVYVGHGSSESFGAEKIWNYVLASSTSYDISPFSIFATCTGLSIDEDRTNVGLSAMKKEDGGSLCLIGAGRTVFDLSNIYLSRVILDAYSKAKKGTTMGQIWMESRNSVINSSRNNEERLINTICYNFGGDPALKVAAPEYKVNITSLANIPMDGTTTDEIAVNALELTSVEGYVSDMQGNKIDDFDGTVTIQLYDSPYIAPVLLRKADDVEEDITLDHDILMTKTVAVKGGEFTANFVAPLPVHEGNPNRITFHADAADGRRGAGVLRNLLVAANDDIVDAPGEAPTIDNFVVNGYADGSYAIDNVRIVANGFVDDAGLNTSTTLGAGSSLVIDGNRRIAGVKDAIVAGLDNTWSLDIAIDNLEVGNHLATLTVADNVGNKTTRTISFTLGTASEVALTSDVTTTRDELTFDIEHSLGDVQSLRFVIEDRSGKQIVNRSDVSFPLTVNLADSDVADGYYTAYVQLYGNRGHGSSVRLPFVYLKKKDL